MTVRLQCLSCKTERFFPSAFPETLQCYRCGLKTPRDEWGLLFTLVED